MRINYLIFALFLFSGIAAAQKKDDFTKCFTESKNVRAFCFSGTGSNIFIADNNKVRISSSLTGEDIRIIETPHKSIITALAVSKDSSVLCTGDKDGILVINNFVSGDIETINNSHGVVTSVSISSNSSYLAAGYLDGFMMVYDLNGMKQLFSVYNEYKMISDVEFSPDCSLIGVTGSGPYVLLIKVQTGEILSRLPGHNSMSRDISFNKSGDQLITCGDDGRVNVYGIDEKLMPKVLFSRKKALKWIACGSFLNDNRSFVYATEDGQIFIETTYSTVQTRLKGRLYKLSVMPRNDSFIKIAASMEDKGLLLLNPMNFENN